MYEAIVLDTETTNNKPEEAEVIELAWGEYSLTSLLGDVEVKRYKPMRACQWGALSTHHILPGDLEDCSPSATVRGDLPAAEYWIGHNIDFDWKCLGIPPVKRICTLAMARSIWPRCDSHKQTALFYFLFGATEETKQKVLFAHGAEVDIGLTARILDHIIDAEGIKSFSDLWQFSEECRVPKIMSFGKFKDQPISAVDRGWANWYARQSDTDPYLLTALRKAGKL